MIFNHKINIFLENKSWINNKIFKSKKNIEEFIRLLFKTTINECFSKTKFKKFKNLKTNINFILTNDSYLKKLNSNFLNKKKTTNVLSFPNGNLLKKNENFLGEIFLSYETCKKEAVKFKINSKDRVGHLVVHGILHLLGYDHKTKLKEEKMIKVEKKILNSLNINYY